MGIGTSNPAGYLTVSGSEDKGEKEIVVGNDAFLTDVNEVNTMGIYGDNDPRIGILRLGNAGAKVKGKENGDLCIGVCN